MRRFLSSLDSHAEESKGSTLTSSVRRLSQPLNHGRRMSCSIPSSSTATLDGLPVELKLLILEFAPNITTLHCLIRASPDFHQAYLLRREKIMNAVLGAEIDPRLLFVAFVAAQEAEFLDVLYENREQRIAEVMETLDIIIDPEFRFSGAMLAWPDNWKTILLREALAAGATMQAARGHFIVSTVASQYCSSVLPTNPVTLKLSKNCLAASLDEQHRVQRAIYRFDLSCKLFGRCRHATSRPPFTENEVSRLFFSGLEVWEVEEVACILQYIISAYENIFKAHIEIFADLDSRISYFQEVGPDPAQTVTTVRVNWGYPLDYKYSYWASLGLDFFHRVSKANYATQTAILTEHYGERDHFSLSRSLGIYRRHHHETKHVNQYTLCDMERSKNEMGLAIPNNDFLFSSERYDLCIFDVPDSIRRWGYIFWDRKRLHDWGVLSLDLRKIGAPRRTKAKVRSSLKLANGLGGSSKGNWWNLKRLVIKEKENDESNLSQ